MAALSSRVCEPVRRCPGLDDLAVESESVNDRLQRAVRWGEVFGDDVAAAAAAMIDRLVHHAEVIALKGDSYRLKTATSAEV